MIHGVFTTTKFMGVVEAESADDAQQQAIENSKSLVERNKVCKISDMQLSKVYIDLHDQYRGSFA